MLQQIVAKTMQQIVVEPLEYFSQFREDFVNDEELKAALDTQSDIILSLIYKHLAMISKQIASESEEAERIFYLRDFFYYIIFDPAITNLPLHLSNIIQQVIEEQPTDICAGLYEELVRDASIKEKLGENIAVLSSLLASSQGG